METKQFQEIVELLEGAFRTELTDKQRDAYWLVLCNEDDAAVLNKAMQICRSVRGRYGFPSPGELLEAPIEDQAELAWGKLTQAIRRFSAYDSVDLEDLAIHRVVEIMGGWELVCSIPTNELHFRRQDFLQLYKVHGAHPDRFADAPKYLTGGREKMDTTGDLQHRVLRLSEGPHKMKQLPEPFQNENSDGDIQGQGEGDVS